MFWNASVKEIWFVCPAELPDDFLDKVKKYKHQIVQNDKEILELKDRYPNCIDKNYFFDFDNEQCNPIKDQFRQLNGQYLQASIDGRKLVESICERSPFWSSKINPTQQDLLLGE